MVVSQFLLTLSPVGFVYIKLAVIMAPTLKEMCTEAGLDENATKYLTIGQGFTVPMQIAKVGKTEEEFLSKIFDPFKEGVTLDEVEYKGVKLIVTEAAFRCLYTQCVRAEAIAEENAKPQLPAVETQGTRKEDGGVKKPPKTLSPGVWTKQIQDFESYYTPSESFSPTNGLRC